MVKNIMLQQAEQHLKQDKLCAMLAAFINNTEKMDREKLFCPPFVDFCHSCSGTK
jgi:hypothetical protein